MSDLMLNLEQATKQVKQNDLANAIESLKVILEEDDEHEIANGMLASVYLQIGHVDAAIDLYEKLLNVNPDNPLARFQLGLARLNRGDAQQALDVWEPMLDMEREFMAHFHSALANLELRRPQRAQELLLNAAKHMPVNHPLYAQLIELQNKLASRPSEI